MDRNGYLGGVPEETIIVSNSQLSYLATFQHAPERVFIASREGTVIDANPSMCHMLGYSRDELIGLDASDILVPPENQCVASVLRDLESRIMTREDWQLRHKDGICFKAGVTLVATPNGDILCLTSGSAAATTDVIHKNRLAAIVESSEDAIIGKDLNSIINSWNAGAERIFGYTAREIIGKSILNLIPADRQDEEPIILEKLRRGEKVRHFETVRLTKDHRLIDVSVTISPIKDAAGAIVGASKIARDITQMKTRQRQMERMSRLYAALAQINQEVPRTGDRDTLFQKVCRLLGEYGGIEMAWIGWHDSDTHRLVPVTRHGDTTGWLEDAEIAIDGQQEGCDPTGIVFRSGLPYICNNMQADPAILPWRRESQKSGYLACAVFPIKSNGVISGTLSVYVSQQDFFQDEEIMLFNELVSDVSMALQGFTLEEQRRQSEQAALREKSFSDNLIDSMPGIVVLIDEQGRMVRWNRNMTLVTGYCDAEIAQMPLVAFVPAEQAPLIEQKIAEVFATGEATSEASLRSIDGTDTPHLFYGSRVDLDGSPCVLGIGLDISRLKQYEQQLQEQDAMFREMSAMAHVGAWEFDPETGEGRWTEEVARIHGVEPEAATNASMGLGFYQGEHRQRIDAAVREAIEHGKSYDLELELITASGESRWVRTISHPVVESGKVVKVRGSVQDITDRRAYEDKIRRLNRVQSVLSQINSLIVRVQDRGVLFAEACRIATQAGEFRMAMVALRDPTEGTIVTVASEGKDAELMAEIRRVLSSRDLAAATIVGKALQDKRAIISNDSQHDPALFLSSKYSEAGVHSIAVLPLIVAEEAVGVLVLYATERGFFTEEEMHLLNELTHDIAFALDHLNKQERLDFLAYYDGLTGLANRGLFLERVGQFIRNTDPGHYLAVFLLDLERFKSINDALGRAAGDAFLIQAAEWLKQHAFDANLLARIGSDHFAAAIPELKNVDAAARLIEKTLTSFQEQIFSFGGEELRIGAKCGIALYPDDGKDAETLLTNAEAALKSAKRNGELYLFHTKRMTASVAARLSLETRLRQAVQREEFVLHYQPKVNIASGKVTSAEALIRWNDLQGGLVPPADFIPLLEETGLIRDVGRWALHRAIMDKLRWQKAGLAVVPVAVNVSALQLRNPDFISEIADMLNIDLMATGSLELEITESVIMEDIDRSVSTLRAIREMGIRIAIDDFGTGFSSLSYLSNLPVDTLKIDRSFVLDMTETPEGEALVSTIINLAHSLKLNVVAEGVETEEQFRLLGLLNCDEMQGFLFSKPVPVEVFEKRFLGQT